MKQGDFDLDPMTTAFPELAQAMEHSTQDAEIKRIQEWMRENKDDHEEAVARTKGKQFYEEVANAVIDVLQRLSQFEPGKDGTEKAVYLLAESRAVLTIAVRPLLVRNRWRALNERLTALVAGVAARGEA